MKRESAPRRRARRFGDDPDEHDRITKFVAQIRGVDEDTFRSLVLDYAKQPAKLRWMKPVLTTENRGIARRTEASVDLLTRKMRATVERVIDYGPQSDLDERNVVAYSRRIETLNELLEAIPEKWRKG